MERKEDGMKGGWKEGRDGGGRKEKKEENWKRREMLYRYLKPIHSLSLISTFSSITIFFFFFGLFRAAPTAHRGSQARGQIRAIAAGLYHSHSNARSEPCLRPTPQLKAIPDP